MYILNEHYKCTLKIYLFMYIFNVHFKYTFVRNIYNVHILNTLFMYIAFWHFVTFCFLYFLYFCYGNLFTTCTLILFIHKRRQHNKEQATLIHDRRKYFLRSCISVACSSLCCRLLCINNIKVHVVNKLA